MQGAVDQIGAVVVRDELHARRQIALVDLLHLRAHMLEHFQSVLAFAQDDDSLHDVVLIRLAGHELAHAPEPQLLADDHPAQIADADGRAVAGVHGDFADVLRVLHQAEAAHDVHLRAMLDVGAAGVAVAIGKRIEDLLERNVVGAQFGRDRSALGIAWSGRRSRPRPPRRARCANAQLHDPIFQRLQLDGRRSLLAL